MAKNRDDEAQERSGSGEPIWRHDALTEQSREPAFPSDTVDEVEAHLSRYFGAPATVFHEILSLGVHVDVHVVEPGPERDHWTLFTTGMSDRPMTTPEEGKEFAYAELVLKLPASWDVKALDVTPPSENHEHLYWPIRALKFLARFPHDYGTWLGFGHTIPNGDPPEPLHADTKLCAWLLLPPISVPDEARTFTTSDGRTVHFYMLHALHLEELSLKLNKGTDALLDAFSRTNVSEILDPRRPPAVRKKLFGLF